MGKLSQAVVIAAAAYRDEATFRERTGISNSRLVVNKKNKDCHVSSSDGALHTSPAAWDWLCTEEHWQQLANLGSAANKCVLRMNDSSRLQQQDATCS